MVFTSIDATHSGIRTSLRSSGLHSPPSQLIKNAPLQRSLLVPTLPLRRVARGWGEDHTRSFGTLLEPRYVVSAALLDQ
jgi:hypothetical protein